MRWFRRKPKASASPELNDAPGIASYLEQLAQLRNEPGLEPEERVQRGLELTNRAVDSLGDGADQLLGALGTSDGVALLLVARAIGRRNATGFASADAPSVGQLMLLPIGVWYHQQEPVPRHLDIPSWAPSLPDGRTVPGMADFLLTWEEVTSPRGCRRLREILTSDAVASATDALLREFGSQSTSKFDTFDSAGLFVRSQRFAPAFRATADPPWFSTDEQMSQWRHQAAIRLEERATERLRALPFIPNAYEAALDDGWNLVASGRLLALAAEAKRVLASSGSLVGTTLLIEPFGRQASGVAETLRISIVQEADWETVAARMLRLDIPRDRALPQEVCERVLQIAETIHLGVRAHVAPRTQDLDTISLDPTRRLVFLLGPTTAFREPVPDGLPLSDVGASDPTTQRWWDWESGAVETDGDLLKTLISSTFDLDADALQPRHSFSLFRGRWYATWVVVLEGLGTTGGAGFGWPPPRSSLELIQTTFAFMSTRAWTRCTGVGFVSAEVEGT